MYKLILKCAITLNNVTGFKQGGYVKTVLLVGPRGVTLHLYLRYCIFFLTLPTESFCMPFCGLISFCPKSNFGKFISSFPSECQTVWIQIRPDVLLGLICVETVRKLSADDICRSKVNNTMNM